MLVDFFGGCDWWAGSGAKLNIHVGIKICIFRPFGGICVSNSGHINLCFFGGMITSILSWDKEQLSRHFGLFPTFWPPQQDPFALKCLTLPPLCHYSTAQGKLSSYIPLLGQKYTPNLSYIPLLGHKYTPNFSYIPLLRHKYKPNLQAYRCSVFWRPISALGNQRL